MEYKEENKLKIVAIALLGYAVICLLAFAYASQFPPMDLETYFKVRYGL
ncbi:MAG TPA: hypothetical protein VK498_12660 [Ferruginibacter sp.]|nr:hypothetical protein [Ferruginibacter sp.]